MPRNDDRNSNTDRNSESNRNDDRRSGNTEPAPNSLNGFESEIDGQIEPSKEKEE